MANSTRYEDLLGRVFDEMRGSLRKVLSPADMQKVRDLVKNDQHLDDTVGSLVALVDVAGDLLEAGHVF